MSEARREFDLYLQLLARLVAARGGDPTPLAQEYVWPSVDASMPTAATSLAPLLTGGQAPEGVPSAVPAGSDRGGASL